MDRRMINQKSVEEKIDKIGFGNKKVDSTTKYRLLETEFVAGAGDNNNYVKYTIEKYIPAAVRYATISGPLVDINEGTILLENIQSVENWDLWTGYSGEVTCDEGKCVKCNTQGQTYVCNISGTKKYMSYEGVGAKFFGDNVSDTGVTTEYGQIKVVPAVPEGVTIIYKKTNLLAITAEDDEEAIED